MPKLPDSICNPEVFEKLFRSHAKGLRNYLYFKYGSEKDAEDVVQEAFVRLWKNCSKVPYDMAKGFLFTTSNNLSLSLKRKDKVRLTYLSERQDDDRNIESPEYRLLEKEFKIKLQSAIESLPERQREAFLLSRIEKKTYLEIGEIMGVSVKAIEKLMHKALLKIRNSIGDV